MGQVTLQFSACDDMGSFAIRSLEHGLWSHVDAVQPDGSLLGARNDEMDGVLPGVRIRPPDYCKFSRTKRVTILCGAAEQEAFDDFIAAQIGKPYDESAIMAFVLGRDWRESDSWFCSELQAAALEIAKIFPYSLVSPANKITPNMLYLACSVLTPITS
jgi:hypothetical protein